MPKSRSRGGSRRTSEEAPLAELDNPSVRVSKRARKERVIFDPSPPSPTEKTTDESLPYLTVDDRQSSAPLLDVSSVPLLDVSTVPPLDLNNVGNNSTLDPQSKKIMTDFPQLDMVLKIKCSKNEVDCNKYKPVQSNKISVLHLSPQQKQVKSFCKHLFCHTERDSFLLFRSLRRTQKRRACHVSERKVTYMTSTRASLRKLWLSCHPERYLPGLSLPATSWPMATSFLQVGYRVVKK